MSDGSQAVRLQALAHFFENMHAADVPRLRTLYREDAYFKDPFNEVHRIEDIERIFARMFEDLLDPCFVITGTVLQDSEAFLTWNFHFRLQRSPSHEQCIRGCSQIHFDDDGLVQSHRDYWDAAEELYEKLPIIGSLMRWLKRRIQG
ncbi:MAG: nuclear transport factor 2 family protein [Lacisediminimonas sp.]|nr:nuclear transport factor 2 family protein [Lacisediminimonas sp.]